MGLHDADEVPAKKRRARGGRLAPRTVGECEPGSVAVTELGELLVCFQIRGTPVCRKWDGGLAGELILVEGQIPLWRCNGK